MRKDQVQIYRQPTDPKASLSPGHREDLQRSGLTEETISRAGIFSVPPDRLERTLSAWGFGWLRKYVHSAYAIPYGTPDRFFRLRLFYTEEAEKLKDDKYLQAPGSGCRAYVPPGVGDYVGKRGVTLWVAEGEKKALRLAQEGVPAIGIGGVWNVLQDGELLPELKTHAQRGGSFVVAFDSDCHTNYQVLCALYSLACRLMAHGAAVYVATWDPKYGKGIDDALAKGGLTLADIAVKELTEFAREFIGNPDTRHRHRRAIVRTLGRVPMAPTVRDALARTLAKALGISLKALWAEVRTLDDTDEVPEPTAAGALPDPEPEVEPDSPPEILLAPDFVLQCLAAVDAVHAEDTVNALALFLALGTLRFAEPVSVIVLGHPTTGKSHLLESVCRLYPKEAIVWLSGLSPKALAYTEESLSHRAIVLTEATTILTSDEAGYFMRTLLTEGRIVYWTVEKTPSGQLRLRKLEKEGPTALLATTTRLNLEPQLATRAWVLESRSDSKYVKEAMKAIAQLRKVEAPDVDAIRKGLKWLYLYGETRVRIPEPMRQALYELMPGKNPTELRLFKRLLRSVEASAFLHQLQRPRDTDGAILATPDDYAIARLALAEAFATALSDLTPRQREVLQTLHSLDDGSGVSLKELAEALQADKSNVRKYLKALQAKGYVAQDAATARWRALEAPEGVPTLPMQLPLPEAAEDTSATTAQPADVPDSVDALPVDGQPGQAEAPDFFAHATETVATPETEAADSLPSSLTPEPVESSGVEALPSEIDGQLQTVLGAVPLEPERLKQLAHLAQQTSRFVGKPHKGCAFGGKFIWLCPGWVQCSGCKNSFDVLQLERESPPERRRYEFADTDTGLPAVVAAEWTAPERARLWLSQADGSTEPPCIRLELWQVQLVELFRAPELPAVLAAARESADREPEPVLTEPAEDSGTRLESIPEIRHKPDWLEFLSEAFRANGNGYVFPLPPPSRN